VYDFVILYLYLVDFFRLLSLSRAVYFKRKDMTSRYLTDACIVSSFSTINVACVQSDKFSVLR